MYRNDMEALQAHIHTLESTLDAERQTREAAEAKERAARAEVQELRLRFDQTGAPKPSPLRRYKGAAIVVAVSVVVLAVLFGFGMRASAVIKAYRAKNAALKSSVRHGHKRVAKLKSDIHELLLKNSALDQANSTLRKKNRAYQRAATASPGTAPASTAKVERSPRTSKDKR